MDIKEAEILRDGVVDHWYYRSKARAVERLTRELKPTRLLDVGAGSGFFSRRLLDRSSAVEAWCVDPNYPADSNIVENGKEIHFCRSIGPVDADLVLLMDVLEHVDDDVGLLRDAVNKASEKATFLISVPAFQFMWSGHDVFLEHKRRYTLAGLERVVEATGLRIRHSTYFFAGVFPVALLVRLPRMLFGTSVKPASDMKVHSRPVNWILNAVSHAELKLVARNRWFGLTAFCVATRE
ncbi:MAG TPA: methyltransferase domain-containing protein [Rudaea sp.]|nr:methyltransferase domain-containing protein [Rudaea sp.]